MRKKRTILLRTWLTLLLVFNLMTAVSFFIAGIGVIESWPLYFIGIFSILNLFFLIMLFRWRRWAFYCFCLVAIAGFVINLLVGNGFVQAFLGLLGPTVLYIIMKPQWALFR